MTEMPPAGPTGPNDGFGAPTYSRPEWQAPPTAAQSAPGPSAPPAASPPGPDLTKRGDYAPPPPTTPPAGPPVAPPPPASPYDLRAPWNAAGSPSSPFAGPTMQVTMPAVAWLVPVAALLAVIGVFVPWFRPELTASGLGQTGSVITVHHSFKALYSWRDGKIGLLAPIVLVVLSLGVIGLLRGKSPARFSRGSRDEVTNAARGVLIAGVVSGVCALIAYFLVKTQYTFDGKSWDDALREFRAEPGVRSASLSRGPQAGYWLTVAGAALAIVAGVLMLVLKKERPIEPTGGAVPPPPYGQPPAPQQNAQPYPPQQYSQPYPSQAPPQQPGPYGAPGQGAPPPPSH